MIYQSYFTKCSPLQLYKTSSLFEQQTLSNWTTWKKYFCTLLGSDIVEHFFWIPKGAFNDSLLGLGKGKAWMRGDNWTSVFENCCQILDTLETWVLFVTLFSYCFPHFSPLSLLSQTKDGAKQHLTHNSAFHPAHTYYEPPVRWWTQRPLQYVKQLSLLHMEFQVIPLPIKICVYIIN